MKNLLTIFFSPGETFERIRDSKTAWILPLILTTILSVVATMLQMPFIINETRLMLQKQGLDAAFIEQTLNSTPLWSYIGIVFMLVVSLFFTALLLILLNLILRGEGRYMQLVNVVAFAGLPAAIGTILTSILLVLFDAKSISDVTLSLGALVADRPSLPYLLLSQISPFAIWGLCLQIIGVAIMMKRPRKKVAIWIVATWVVFTLISVLYSASRITT
ncbi:Yip1 family protein [Paenibacillus fonticola]|uniref:Yip1 family protein n=1 Tax=Paenibacillus fonticola TaxID=379896 RepID=UPI00037EAF56|nr:Yip1 family protein [Paenibacillus fonticola]